MSDKIHRTNNKLTRENFLLSLLNKVIKEYKFVLDLQRKTKPLKIIEIIELSNIPGETQFAIQVTNKNCILNLTAADIIKENYNLDDFSSYHAEIIRQAAQGKLIHYLKLSNNTKQNYKIISKKYDRDIKQYIFTIENSEKTQIIRTADELIKDKEIIAHMDFDDVFNIGYTQGSESIIKEKIALQLVKSKDYSAAGS